MSMCVCSVSLILVTTIRALIILQKNPPQNAAVRPSSLSMSAHVSMCTSIKPDLFLSLTIHYNYSLRTAFMGLAELKLYGCLLFRASVSHIASVLLAVPLTCVSRRYDAPDSVRRPRKETANDDFLKYQQSIHTMITMIYLAC